MVPQNPLRRVEAPRGVGGYVWEGAGSRLQGASPAPAASEGAQASLQGRTCQNRRIRRVGSEPFRGGPFLEALLWGRPPGRVRRARGPRPGGATLYLPWSAAFPGYLQGKCRVGAASHPGELTLEGLPYRGYPIGVTLERQVRGAVQGRYRVGGGQLANGTSPGGATLYLPYTAFFPILFVTSSGETLRDVFPHVFSNILY